MALLDAARRDIPNGSALPRALHGQWSYATFSARRGVLRLMLLLAVAVASLGIATQAPAANQQQERMKSCNSQAKSQTLSGAERKDFMKHCLAGEDTGSAKGLNSQQRKMKTCSAEAKSQRLKGSERQQFMSSCLKSSS